MLTGPPQAQWCELLLGFVVCHAYKLYVFCKKNVCAPGFQSEDFPEGHLATMKARRDLRPRDLVDIQFFLWVQGSDEYPG
jgi:hypothetical protein